MAPEDSAGRNATTTRIGVKSNISADRLSITPIPGQNPTSPPVTFSACPVM